MSQDQLSKIEDQDCLGRSVLSQRQADAGMKIQKSIETGEEVDRTSLKARQKVFEDKSKNLSVDRLGHSDKDLIKIQEKRAESLAGSQGNHKKIFYGWFKLSVLCAKKNGRDVRAAPTVNPRNPYHAIIVFPENLGEDQKKQHIIELAVNSIWLAKEEIA